MIRNTLLITGILTLLPISELRGGIPYALSQSLNPIFTYLYCVALNILVTPVVFAFLSTLHGYLYRWKAYRQFFEHIIKRTRKKIAPKVEKYGYLGLTIFVAIPLPVTGAYTGAIGAWILGMGKKRSFLAISVGVAIAGIIVSLVSYYGIKTLYFFIK